MAYTPGPWEISKLGNGLHILGDRRPGSAQVIATVGGSSQINLEANARLITAAPELLELLKGINAALQTNYTVGSINYEFGDKLNALLKRVEGDE